MQTYRQYGRAVIVTIGRHGARVMALVAACSALACSGGSEQPAPSGTAAAPATGGGQGGVSGNTGMPGSGGSAAGASGGGTAAPPPTAGTSAGAGGAAGDDPNAIPPAGGASGGTADAGMAGDGATEPTPGGPRLPPVADPGDSGEFEIQVVETLDGLSTHIMIAPQELGRDGIKHPVLVWINGAGANSSSYRNMHDNLAAQGFVIVDDKQSTFEAIPEIDSQRAAIDWVVAQTQDASSPYHGKFDDTRIAIGGHSLGSVASFGNVADPRITTSVHMAGGVTGNPGGVDNALIETLRAPTLFLCGSADTNGLGRVRNDFAMAPPAVPLFFGTLAGVGHTDEFSGENGGRWGRIVAAWLRWRLADDESAAALFAGDDCEFCTGDWTAMKRAL
jgi:hypothetical protein